MKRLRKEKEMKAFFDVMVLSVSVKMVFCQKRRVVDFKRRVFVFC